MEQRQRLRFFQTTSTTQTRYEATNEYISTPIEMENEDSNEGQATAAGGRTINIYCSRNSNVYFCGQSCIPKAFANGNPANFQETKGNRAPVGPSCSTVSGIPASSGGPLTVFDKQVYLRISVMEKRDINLEVMLDKRWEGKILEMFGTNRFMETLNYNSTAGVTGLVWNSEDKLETQISEDELSTSLSFGDLAVVPILMGGEKCKLILNLKNSYEQLCEKIGEIAVDCDCESLNILREIITEGKKQVIMASFKK